MSWVSPVHWITVIQISPYVPTEINRSYQMSSFVETKALEQLTKCPVEFVEYPSHFYWRMFVLNVTHGVSFSVLSLACQDISDDYIIQLVILLSVILLLKLKYIE